MISTGGSIDGEFAKSVRLESFDADTVGSTSSVRTRNKNVVVWKISEISFKHLLIALEISLNALK